MFDKNAQYKAKEKVLEILSSGAEESAIQEGLKKVLARTTELDLNYSTILDEGAKHLANALKVNTTLEVLYLLGNKIGDEGAKQIVDVLQINKILKILNLGENEIGSEMLEV